MREDQDQSPNTLHNAETKRFSGLYGTFDAEDSEQTPTSSAPDTSSSGDENRDTTPSLSPFQLQDEAHAEHHDRKTDITLVTERKTLPSAHHQATPPPQHLDWEEPSPTATEPTDESPTFWNRVQRFVKNLGGKKQPTTTPPPLDSREKPTLQSLLHLTWSLDNGEIEDLAAHLEHILSLRKLGPDAYTEARILHTLKAPNPPQTLAELRQTLQEIPKQTLEDALLRLDEKQHISLGPADEIHLPNRAAS